MFKPEVLTGAKDLETFMTHLQQELERIGFESSLPQPGVGILLPELFVAPQKPRNGLVVFADGTTWNPGAGAGIYAYYGGIWNHLG